jgi:hypothetical protein
LLTPNLSDSLRKVSNMGGNRKFKIEDAAFEVTLGKILEGYD